MILLLDIEQPPKPDRFIKDGDKIKVGKFELEVLYTPGHSPGGVCFLYDKMVFGGDTLFQGSIGRTDFRQGSLEDLSKSIKNVTPLLGISILLTLSIARD